MSDNTNEIKIIPSSNPSLVLDAVETDSVNGTVAPDDSSCPVSEQDYFWIGVKLPKSLVFGGLGYVAGGFVGVYGGFYGVYLAGVLGLHFYYYFV